MHRSVCTQRFKANIRSGKIKGPRADPVYSTAFTFSGKAAARPKHAGKEHIYAELRNGTCKRDNKQRGSNAATPSRALKDCNRVLPSYYGGNCAFGLNAYLTSSNKLVNKCFEIL